MNGKGVCRDVLSVQAERMPGPHGIKEPTAHGKGTQVSERMSLCTSDFRIRGKRRFLCGGSMTIEAALLVPLFWYAISGFLYLLLVFRLQEDVSQALADAGRELGLYAYSSDVDGDSGLWNVSLLRVKQKLQKQCKDRAALQFVEGGLSGIHLWGSSVLKEKAQIELVASYELRTPWILLGFDSFPVVQKQVCRAWIGYTGELENGEREEVVYVTPYGEKYHHSLECRYLSLSIRAVSGQQVRNERNEDGERYGSCESCCEGGPDALVYITNYGNRYHESLACVGLKRTVQMVLLSEAHGKTPCTGCGAGG